jgi:hypothetical protein
MEALFSYFMKRDISNFDPNVIPEGLKVIECECSPPLSEASLIIC